MGVGMKSILEKIIPAADVRLFGDFESFTEANPERFFPFFIGGANLRHARQFSSRARRSKTILLCSGHPQPAYADMHCIDVHQQAIVRDILRMHHGAHRSEHIVPGAVRPETAPLSGREAEVLALIARGYMKQTDRRQPANRAYDRHFAPPQHHGEGWVSARWRVWPSTP